jgi:hypothetical protein
VRGLEECVLLGPVGLDRLGVLKRAVLVILVGVVVVVIVH